MNTLQGIFEISLIQGLLFAIVSIGSYITFRFLSFPDLSPEGTFPLGAAVGATLIAHGISPWTATAAGMGAGAVGGFLTAVLYTKLGINGILAGILTLTATYTVNLRVMTRPNVAILTEPTVFDDLYAVLGLNASQYSLMAVLAVFVGVVVAGLTWLFHTEFGLSLRATGDNEGMIRGLGVSTDTTTLVGLTLANALVGTAGALVAQYQGFADVGMGVGTIVAAFAGLIIGETVFRGRVVGWALISVVLGVLLYRLLLTSALYFGAESSDLKLISAVLVAAVLSLPALGRRYRIKRV
jgi:putative tryptophan/tyrosine transport system permease protein